MRKHLAHYPQSIGEGVDLWQWLYYCTRPEMMEIITGHVGDDRNAVEVEGKFVCARGFMSGVKGFEKKPAGR